MTTFSVSSFALFSGEGCVTRLNAPYFLGICLYCHAKVSSYQRKPETCTLTFISRYSRLLSPFSTVQHYSKPLTIFIFLVFMACSYTRQAKKINVNTVD